MNARFDQFTATADDVTKPTSSYWDAGWHDVAPLIMSAIHFSQLDRQDKADVNILNHSDVRQLIARRFRRLLVQLQLHGFL